MAVTKDVHFLVNTGEVLLTLQITRAITVAGICKPTTGSFVMHYKFVINL